MYQDRIKTFKRISADKLVAHELNWREHDESQRETMQSVLDRVGIAGALIVHPIEDGKYRVVNGHLRASLDPSIKWPCLVLHDDVTEDEINFILSTFDPVSAMATANPELFEQLVAKLEAETEEFEALFNGIQSDYSSDEIEQLATEELPNSEDTEAVDEDMIHMSLPLTIEQNTAIKNAVKKARLDLGAENTPEALHIICNRFMNGLVNDQDE